jgi:hypothetical protein
MPIRWKYKMWCEDEQAVVSVWGDANTNPVCPNNPAHTIDYNRKSGVDTNENYQGVKNYCVKDYLGQRLIKETWYEVDNGDGTYSQKVEETVYNYIQNKITSKTTTTFWLDESEILSKTETYYTKDNKIIIKKS